MSSESGELEVFVAIDGDHVGESIESFLANHDLVGVKRFSQDVAQHFRDLRARLEQLEATIHFSEGDSLLVSFPRCRFNPAVLQDLPIGPCTVSIGIGWNSRTVLMALKIAKALGRNQVFSLLDGDELRSCGGNS